MKRRVHSIIETTLPRDLPARSVAAMLRGRAKKKGFSLGPWTYNPKTGRATFGPA